jgi:hypothetical protein
VKSLVPGRYKNHHNDVIALIERDPFIALVGEPSLLNSQKFFGRIAMAFTKIRVAAFTISTVFGFVAASLANAEVLFNSLSSPNSGAVENEFEAPLAASFNTGSSAVQITDVALSLNSTFSLPGDTFTVSLVGGAPLADVTFVDGVGLVFDAPLSTLRTVTLPISDLSSSLTVEHFSQLTDVNLQPDSFYAIAISFSPQSQDDGATVGWGVTDDDAGPGVIDGYNASWLTDNGFFPNKPTPAPNNGGPIFQMEISGMAAPEISTWAMMLLGFAGLGYAGWRGSRRAAAD